MNSWDSWVLVISHAVLQISNTQNAGTIYLTYIPYFGYLRFPGKPLASSQFSIADRLERSFRPKFGCGGWGMGKFGLPADRFKVSTREPGVLDSGRVDTRNLLSCRAIFTCQAFSILLPETLDANVTKDADRFQVSSSASHSRASKFNLILSARSIILIIHNAFLLTSQLSL